MIMYKFDIYIQVSAQEKTTPKSDPFPVSRVMSAELQRGKKKHGSRVGDFQVENPLKKKAKNMPRGGMFHHQ